MNPSHARQGSALSALSRSVLPVVRASFCASTQARTVATGLVGDGSTVGEADPVGEDDSAGPNLGLGSSEHPPSTHTSVTRPSAIAGRERFTRRSLPETPTPTSDATQHATHGSAGPAAPSF